MPDIPWKSFGIPDLDREYVLMASALPLRSRLRVPAFLRMTLAVRRQLSTSPGLRGYSLRADILGARFWTLSAWDDDAALRSFARAMPHLDIMRKLRPHMGRTKFVTWHAPGSALPMRWQTGMEKLADG